jgi:hypothetical protein
MKRLACALLIPALLVAALFAGHANAQDDYRLNLPFAANDWQARTYFTLPELEAGQRAAGYPPEQWAEHTVCNLAPNTPQGALWFDYCEQPWRIDENGDEDWSTTVLYTFDPVTDKVTWKFIQGAPPT